jgi:geranylgeranyl diphosphate synthase type I
MNLQTAWKRLAADASHLEAVRALMDRLVGDDPTDICAEMAASHLVGGGKYLRASLALGAAAALGVDPRLAVPWAAACELMHNASLIHDDLQDGDEVRRDRPAVWRTYGKEQAVNAGDMMLMLSVRAVFETDLAHFGPSVVADLASCIARRGDETARGQAREMQLRARRDFDRAHYLEAARGKTAGLFGLPVEGAALLAGYAAEEASALAKPFEALGLLYQLQDDVIDLYRDKGRGAPGADLREGKVSALVVWHAALHPEDDAWLHALLTRGREGITAGDVVEASERFAVGGALVGVLDAIASLADAVDDRALSRAPGLVAAAVSLRDVFLGPLAGLGPDARAVVSG